MNVAFRSRLIATSNNPGSTIADEAAIVDLDSGEKEHDLVAIDLLVDRLSIKGHAVERERGNAVTPTKGVLAKPWSSCARSRCEGQQKNNGGCRDLQCRPARSHAGPVHDRCRRSECARHVLPRLLLLVERSLRSHMGRAQQQKRNRARQKRSVDTSTGRP
jgi:hypothetical protein